MVTLFTPIIAFDVVLKGDLFTKRVSSYFFIFCAILNNLARVIYVISNRQVSYCWAA